ncbi:hypothetical protein SBRCBS47491_002230 [Sporothrix bragantina]|uniref:Uncharacterized protein n=1 Tax=Sporothrix bragantina TaxID=671064 RepID=A0ABP0B541_9PEZI
MLSPNSSFSSTLPTINARDKVQTSMTGNNIFLLILSIFLIIGCILFASVLLSKRAQRWVVQQCGRREEDDEENARGNNNYNRREAIPLVTFTRPILNGVRLPVRNDVERGLPPPPPSSRSLQSSATSTATSRASWRFSRPTASPRLPFAQENRMVVDGLATNDVDNNSSYGLNSEHARLVCERLLTQPLPRLPVVSFAAAAAVASPPPSPLPAFRTATASPVQMIRPSVVNIRSKA